jgi:preprotein translocase subunit SecF
VIGYSVNDTIVVYDRIRDNFKLMRRRPVEHIVNVSVNQTLSRTIVTGLTTLLVLLALLFLGGDTLWGFAMALIAGIVIGTFSSVYVASAMAVILRVDSEDFAERPRDPADELP